MKTSTILVGLTMSLLLLALPAAASDYTLGVFGNANEDDTINMQDVTYTELIILEYKDQTQLADGKHDDRINMQDVTQIELIILEREKELTVLDATDRIVTINKPVERIASSSMPQDIRTICALGAADKIVGIPDIITDEADRFPAIYIPHPELLELPIAGSPYFGGPYLEVIASLEPDLVLVSYADADAVQEAVGVPTIAVPAIDMNALAFKGFKWLKMMGYVLGEQERAEYLSSYFNDKLDEVSDVTSEIDEKPEVYLAFWTDFTYTPATYAPVEVAGGINVADDPGTYGPYGSFMWQVSKEQIITWNPDRILIHSYIPTMHMISMDDVLDDLDLQTIPAVENKDIYYTKGFQFGWDPATGVVECFYMAKLFHPDEFAGLDVEGEGNEILEEVYGVDGIWTEMNDMFDLHTWD
ncbi:MAG: ABC transporter substrate-binding protein [Caldisericota bacterium]|nr:ABC transporter substrate-binding protein [Caldisericota bacterium]